MVPSSYEDQPRCTECGNPLKFVADIPQCGFRPYTRVFKCTGCARILVLRDAQAS